MRALSFVVAQAIRDLRRTGVAGVGGILLVALAVLVGGGTIGGLEGLSRVTAAWRAELRIVALIRVEATDGSGSDALLGAVRTLPGVGAVHYLSTEAALAELRRHLGPAGNGLDRLPTNPVPARVEVTPLPGLRAVGLRALIDALGRVPGVDEVQAAVGWVGEAERIERVLRVAGLGLAGVLGLTATLVIAGATTLARRRRADETVVLRLAGVSEARLWTPLWLQGLAQGGAGAALGVSLLVLASEAGADWLTTGLRVGIGLAPLPVPSGSLAAALLGAGLVTGLLGSLGAGRP